jgi:membrane-associated phospholipid phosphatase
MAPALTASHLEFRTVRRLLRCGWGVACACLAIGVTPPVFAQTTPDPPPETAPEPEAPTPASTPSPEPGVSEPDSEEPDAAASATEDAARRAAASRADAERREIAKRRAEERAQAELEKQRETYDFSDVIDCPFCVLTPGQPAEGVHGLHWHRHWGRVGWAEYIATPLLYTATIVERSLPARTSAGWTGGILFDSWARDTLVFDSTTARDTAATISDAFFYASIIQPVVVDGLLVTWAGRQSPDVAWQMFVINAQAYAMTLSLVTAAKRIAGRERPFGKNCPDETGEFSCNSPDRYRSFYSGHAAVTATGAGLICAHHTQLELYRDSTADTATCIASVGISLATGGLRMTSDNHWATDVATGYLMGYVTGYLLPTLFYYRDFRITPHEHPESRPRVVTAVLPWATDDSLELRAIGIF